MKTIAIRRDRLVAPISVLLICAAAGLVSPAAAQAVALDRDALARLKAGEVIVEVTPDPQGAAGLIAAVIDIAAPPKVVWSAMTDCERSKRTLPALKVCRVIEQGPDGRYDVREHVVQWIWPLPAVRSVFRSDYKPFERIEFKLTGGDLKVMEGEWRLEALKSGAATRLSYRARITPGWPVPDALVRGALLSDIPNTLTALRREATGRE